MAVIYNNHLLKGASGALGRNVVYKRWRGRTVMANMPKKAKSRSEKQQTQSTQFYYAAYYAREQTKKPELKALYKKGIDDRKFSAYAVALTDFLNPPEIKDITAEGYRGEPGDIIRIRAIDDFMVASVTVTITDAHGRTVEKGQAIKRGKRGLWRMITTVRNANVTGTIITVEAKDLPENSAKATLTITGDGSEPVMQVIVPVVPVGTDGPVRHAGIPNFDEMPAEKATSTTASVVTNKEDHASDVQLPRADHQESKVGDTLKGGKSGDGDRGGVRLDEDKSRPDD